MIYKNTVTVGIPAYNEEKNIVHMIKSVLSQRRDNFVLEKIIVISDGSADSTESKVREIAEENPTVVLVADGRRTGKAERLNQLYGMNQSDIFVQFDADIILSNDRVIDDLADSLISSGADVVGGNGRPAKGKKFIEIISNAGDYLWHEIKKGFNGGDNIYNSQGCVFAMKKDFARFLKYPKGTVSDQQYLYLEAKMAGKRFKFDEGIVIYYRAPNNFKDFYGHKWRGINETDILIPHFGHLIEQSRYMPFSYKFKILLKKLFKEPVKTIFGSISLLFIKIVVFFVKPGKDVLHEKGLWETLHSTKNTDRKIGNDPVAFKIKRAVIVKLYRFWSLFGFDKKIISVLCYHSISDEKYSHAVDLDMFSSEIEKISQFAKFISLDEVGSILSGKKITGPCVAITFDDGYKDLIKALPILKKYSVPATVFVMSEPERVDAEGIGNGLDLLTMEEIKFLHSQGVSIGAHSSTHPDFQKLDEKEFEREIVESKKVLEERLGFAVDYYAYPRGFYNEKIVEVVKRAGFKGAFTIEAGGINRKTNKWLIPRTTITKNHTLSEIPAVFSPVSFFFRKISKPFGVWEKFLTHGT